MSHGLRRTLPAALRRALIGCATAAWLALAGCGSSGGGDEPPPPPPPPPAVVTGSVSGLVVQASSGAPLAGVAVSVGTRTATTAANGRYTLTDVPVAERTVVAFELAGHARTALTLGVTANTVARGDARLTVAGATQTVASAGPATVSVPGSPAQVSLPAAGYVTAGGAAYTGNVTVQLTAIDPASDPANMPGNYTAQGSGGTVRTIESFGAITVALKDAAGNNLNLGAGKTATIRIPLSTRSASPPATIPLFFFNEATGLWVEEGTATLAGTAPNRYYEGTVTHFTTWNADQSTLTIPVRGRVLDTGGACIPNTQVESYGVDYTGRSTVIADANCNFELPIRRGSVAVVYAQAGDRVSNPLRVGPSEVAIDLSSPLALSAAAVAPQIVEQPVALTADVGGFAFFQVGAVGTPTLRYQWKRNGVDLADQTRAILVVVPITADDNGASYTVVVSNANGSVTSQGAVLTVNTVPQTPQIVAQPLAQTAAPGATATFGVGAFSQGGTLSYQWRRNGNAIAGATADTYTTPPLVLADNGALFSVVISSSNGTSVTSANALLTVVAPAPLAITSQPQSVSVGEGQGAGFSVATSGGTGAIAYQWRRNGTAISGATASSYTTPPTTVAANNGDRYSVVVTRGSESVTSNDATLTVTAPVGGSGHYLLAPAGLVSQSAITYANGSQNVDVQVLLAVNPAAPGNGAVTVETAVPTSSILGLSIQGSVNAGQATNLRVRSAAYFKGGRLYKVDQVVAQGGTPAPQLLSTLTPAEVCGDAGEPVQYLVSAFGDLAQPLRTWILLRGPGADAQCNTADDTTRAVRLEMSATDAALTLVGEPQVEVRAADGSITGFVLRRGNQLLRLDANLANETPLFTVDLATYRNVGLATGASSPGIWLFSEAGKLYGVNLATPASRTELATLNAGEAEEPIVTADGGVVFVGLVGATDSRVLRVSGALAVTPVTTLAGVKLTGLDLTPTRLVLTLGGTGTDALQPSAVSTLPRAGGALTPLLEAATGVTVSQLLTSGENVYIGTTQFGFVNGSVSFVVRTIVVGADASNRLELAQTAIVRGLAPATLPLTSGREVVYAVIVAEGATAPFGNAGATVRVLEGATRAPLFTYGSAPATPPGFLFNITLDPLQYGQSGLFVYLAGDGSGGNAASTDLYYFKSDAPGLLRVTNLIAGRQAATGAGAQPAAVRRPAALAATQKLAPRAAVKRPGVRR